MTGVDTARLWSPEADKHELPGKMQMKATRFDKNFEFAHGWQGSREPQDQEVLVKKAVSMNANEANPKYELFRKATLELGDSQRPLKVNTDKTGKSAFESNPTPVQPQDLILNSGGQ